VSLKIDDVTIFTSDGKSSNDVTANVTHPRSRYGIF
jgi:hypothetical protein